MARRFVVDGRDNGAWVVLDQQRPDTSDKGFDGLTVVFEDTDMGEAQGVAHMAEELGDGIYDV